MVATIWNFFQVCLRGVIPRPKRFGPVGTTAAEGRRVDAVVEGWVPGSSEIPLAAKVLATSRRVGAIVCVGVVIGGETMHYELIAEGSPAASQQVQLETGVPVAVGVLTVENRGHAVARSHGRGRLNVGEDAALAALEIARLHQG